MRISGGSAGQESTRNAGDLVGSLGLEDPPRGRKWQPTPGFLPGKSQGSLVGYSPWGRKTWTQFSN